MRIGQAKELARRWVHDEATGEPGFCGAFYHGSTNWHADETELPATSDFDVMVVHADPDPPAKPGKFLYRGLLLEVSCLAFEQLRSPDAILGNDQLAGSFRHPGIILDPTGRLTEVGAFVSATYAKRPWVHRRCENARDNVLKHARTLRQSTPFHDQVTSWLFATGVLTHVLLVAGLENPTVRKRYVAARDLLTNGGRRDCYDPLLELLGCARMSPKRVEHHLTALAAAFDDAKAVITTPFFFASDISDAARPIALDGSRELIDRGLHREAVFWLVAAYGRCQKVLFHDAPPDLRDRHDPGFRHLLADLGITSFADLRRRTSLVERFLPRVWEVAGEIMAANPEIEE
jgi:hypothetical protein